MTDLRRARERNEELPQVVLVHQGDVASGEQLLAGLWPDAPAIADPERKLYDAFGLGRGGLMKVMGPRTWLAGLRALFRGHLVGKPVGDPLVLPGMFLVAGERVLWKHEFEHSGDRPSTDELVTGVALALAGA